MRNKSDRTSQEPHDFTPVWDVKLKATTEQTRKTKLTDTNNSRVVTRGEGWGQGSWGHMCGDRRRPDCGWALWSSLEPFVFFKDEGVAPAFRWVQKVKRQDPSILLMGGAVSCSGRCFVKR